MTVDRCCRILSLLPPTFTAAAKVSVRFVPTVILTGHSACLDATPAKPIVGMVPKRPEENRSGLRQGLAPVSAACLANRKPSVLCVVCRTQSSCVQVVEHVA